MEVYSNCTLCNNSLSEEEKKKNEKHQLFLHPMCNVCLKSITGDVEKVFSKKK